MPREQDYKIRLTTDSNDFKSGATMMVSTAPWTTLGFNYEDCLKAFTGICKEIYVAEKDNMIAGFVILQVCGSFSGYIQTICVGEEFRSKGLGKILLRFCEKRIHKISPNLFICVSAFNQRAVKLYYEFGFEPIGVLKDFVKKGFDELLLRKTIGPRMGYVSKNFELNNS
jgi:[ribosomal protein S18]-alanine N-acetyltransferase